VIPTVPGNHDIGVADGIRADRLNRFKTHFTDRNSTSQRLEICGFDVLLLDSPSLLNTAAADVYEPTSQFLDNVTELRPGQGRLLFTHIPLYRPPDTNCGPDRESWIPIHAGGGHQYQNMLTAQISTRILDTLWPVQGVFSGDDHDSCVINHELEGTRDLVPEYTVKSFSWAMVSAVSVSRTDCVGSQVSGISTSFTWSTSSGNETNQTKVDGTVRKTTRIVCHKVMCPPFSCQRIHHLRAYGDNIRGLDLCDTLFLLEKAKTWWSIR